MAKAFPDNYLHLGGDELSYRIQCWNTSGINTWMQQNGIATYLELENYFVGKTQVIAKQSSKTLINWQELFNDGISLQPNTIVQVWKDHETLDAVVTAGYQGLMSFGWYLGPGASWKDFYLNEPIDGTLNQAQAKRVLGGEAAMWAEGVDDTNVEQTIFPIVGTVAERLWSMKTINSTDDAFPRFHDYRCRLRSRGVLAAPEYIGFCY